MRLTVVTLLVVFMTASSLGKRYSSSSSSRSSSSSSSRSSFGSRIKQSLGFGRRSSSSGSSSSSYPKQNWGSSSSGSSYPKQNYGSNPSSAGTGGFSNPSSGVFSNPSSGGFSKPNSAGAGGFSNPSSAGGFSNPRPAGAGGFANPSGGIGSQPIGGGGFVKPGTTGVQTPGSAGGFVKPGTQGSSSIGGGGFVKPPSNTGSGLGTAGTAAAAGGLGAAGGFAAGSLGGAGKGSSGLSGLLGGGSKGIGSSSSGGLSKAGLAGVGGAGALGGLAASRYSYPKVSKLSNMFHKKPKTMTSPGYGSAWGTKFKPDQVYKQKKGFSKKALGLGVAAGFVGGAALGVAGTMATYSVYHRYQEFKNMMRMRGFGDYNDDNGFYGNSYSRNECMGGCPMNSHCEWGFCECNYGFERRFGHCGRVGSTFTPRPVRFDPFVSCSSTAMCQEMDINMICNTNLTVQAGGKCQCKADMKWNEGSGECQFFFDVDCTRFTYETPPSKFILDAVKTAETEVPQNPIPQESDEFATPTREQSLGTSLLSHIDRNRATEMELKEAYCRDIDAFSFDFNVDDGKPPRCDPVPRTACGVVYDSGSCSGGFKLIISEGEITFPYFSSYWKYRNDIDLVGVKAGCTLTGFSDTNYSGKRGTFRADATDRWWVLKEYAEFLHLHQDIESIQCVCRKV